MKIELTNKEIKTMRRLRIALQSGVILVGDFNKLLSDLQQKIERSAGAAEVVKNEHKEDRKNKYRQKLKVA